MEQNVSPSKSPEAAVKEAVAELEECRPSELGTLSEVVSIAELNSLGSSSLSSREDEIESITFDYCGYSIEFDSNRTLSIQP